MKKILFINQKTIITALFVVCSIFTFAQTNYRFYKTVEDYAKDKPIEGIEIIPWTHSLVGPTLGNPSETVKVLKNGVKEKMKLTEAPSEWYTYDNSLCKTYDKKMYMVLAVGHYCYYAYVNGAGTQKYSETITGEMNNFNQKWLEGELEKYELLEAYKKDMPKRELNDSGSRWLTKLVTRNVKYINLLNEKLKK